MSKKKGQFLASVQSHKGWPIFLAVVAATAGIVVGYSSVTKGRQGWPQPPLWLVLTLTIGLAVLTLADKLFTIFGESALEATRARLRVTEAMYTLLASLADETGLPVWALGASLFVPEAGTFDPKGSLVRAHRCRLVPNTPPSSVAWIGGKGAVGECWETQAMVHHDLTPSLAAWAKKPSDKAFQRLPAKVRKGMTHAEFLSASGKYKEVLAVPLVSPGGKRLGVLSVDALASAEQASGNDLGSTSVQDLLGQATDMIRDDLGRLEQLQ